MTSTVTLPNLERPNTGLVLTTVLKTRDRLGNFGSGSSMINGEKPRAPHGSSIGSGFGSGGGGWNGGIWGSPIGSGLKNGSNDIGRIQGRSEDGGSLITMC